MSESDQERQERTPAMAALLMEHCETTQAMLRVAVSPTNELPGSGMTLVRSGTTLSSSTGKRRWSPCLIEAESQRPEHR